jgi:PhzF family phenazine biosynthesis protein
MKTDEQQLKAFCLDAGIDIVLVFTEQVSRTSHGFRTRVFAPKFGYLEDPATGSGNSAFGYYLLNNGIWDGAMLAIEQNGSYDHPNTVRLSTVRDGEGKRVVFGGAATVRIDGRYRLQG